MMRHHPRSTLFPYTTLSRSLPPHLLDEDGQRELAAALNLPGVRALSGEHPDRHVADELLVEAVLDQPRSEEHTSELQSRQYLVCRLLLEKKKQVQYTCCQRF